MTAGVTPRSTLLIAAGTVCWTEHRGKVRVLLVQPSGRAEVGFPKGKVDPGETWQEAAVRETLEETTLEVTLGASLPDAAYTLPGGREKVVHYWSAEVSESDAAAIAFRPNAEIARAEWVPLRTARDRLSFEVDRAVLDELISRIERDSARTFAIIALRHGKTVPAGSWNGPDSTRPLEQVGMEQARVSARAIAQYHPTKLISSTAARCVSTIEPIARITGLDVKATAAISQDAHEDGAAAVDRVIVKRLRKKHTSVLCSHGPVIPDIISEIADATGAEFDQALRRAASLSVGAFSVVHLAVANPAGGIVAVETYDPSASLLVAAH